MQLPIRRLTRSIQIGPRFIGSQHPILVQSMTVAKPSQTDTCLEEIHRLESVGCDFIRVAIPDMASAKAVKILKQASSVPLIADIHFDPDLALEVIDQGIDKIRLNPSNIKDPGRIREIVQAAHQSHIPIRVGANAGSVKMEGNQTLIEALFQALEKEVALLESLDFHQIVLSAKCSSIELNWKLNQLIASRFDYPIYLGLTEAGLLAPGIVQTTLSLSSLLQAGIGDTIRFSLTGELEQEVNAGKALLQALGMRQGVRIIACPMCGRSRWDVQANAEKVTKALSNLDQPLTIAIMGCEVNGPGEAREADFGLAGSGAFVVYFEKGEILDKGTPDEMLKKLLHTVQNQSGFAAS